MSYLGLANIEVEKTRIKRQNKFIFHLQTKKGTARIPTTMEAVRLPSKCNKLAKEYGGRN